MRIARLMATCVLVPMTALPAQRMDPSAFAATPSVGMTPRTFAIPLSAGDSVARVGAMAFSGIMAGALGAFVGGMAGYSMRSCSADEWFCGMGEMFAGGLIGEVLLLPYGVHMNGKRTTLGAKARVSAIIAGVGVAAAIPTQGVTLLVVPPAQVIALIAMEQARK